jgi:hypothetical protein
MSALPSTASITDATAADAVCAGVLGMHWRVVHWLPRSVKLGSRIVVGITVPDRRDWPSEFAMVLGVEGSNERVGDRSGDQCPEARAVDDVHLLGNSNLAIKNSPGRSASFLSSLSTLRSYC